MIKFYIKIILTLFECSCCYHTTSISIASTIFLIKLKLIQNMLRRYDFKALLQSMRTNTAIANGVALFIVFVFLCYQACQVLNYLVARTLKMVNMMKMKTSLRKEVNLLRLFVILYLQSWIAMQLQVVSIWESITYCTQDILLDKCSNLDGSYIGGGKANDFSYYELKPYAVSNNAFDASTKFKFLSYVLKDNTVHYSNVESFVLVDDTSFRVMSPKLTIVDLKTIAASHGIFFH